MRILSASFAIAAPACLAAALAKDIMETKEYEKHRPKLREREHRPYAEGAKQEKYSKHYKETRLAL